MVNNIANRVVINPLTSVPRRRTHPTCLKAAVRHTRGKEQVIVSRPAPTKIIIAAASAAELQNSGNDSGSDSSCDSQ